MKFTNSLIKQNCSWLEIYHIIYCKHIIVPRIFNSLKEQYIRNYVAEIITILIYWPMSIYLANKLAATFNHRTTIPSPQLRACLVHYLSLLSRRACLARNQNSPSLKLGTLTPLGSGLVHVWGFGVPQLPRSVASVLLVIFVPNLWRALR
jgi:hypothetical protein